MRSRDDDAVEVAREDRGAPTPTGVEAWRSAARRVSLHPALPVQATIDVGPSATPSRVTLSCTILTTDVYVPPEVCRSPPYDQPTIWVTFREDVPAEANDDQSVRAVQDLLRKALIHEIDECVLVDGRPTGDATASDPQETPQEDHDHEHRDEPPQRTEPQRRDLR